LEAGFAVGGWVFRRLQRAPERTGRFTVLCVGDSYTWGVGGRSYPDQLQEILDQRSGPGVFRVINKGLGGSTTCAALDLLTTLPPGTRPDFVVLLSGTNNTWNLQPHQNLTGSDALHALLLKSRTYKFAYLLRRAAAERTRRDASNVVLDDWEAYLRSVEHKALDGGLPYARRALERGPLSPSARALLAESGPFDAALVERILREELARRGDPGAAAVLARLSILRRDFSAAVSTALPALRNHPRDTRLLYALATAYGGLGRTREEESALKALLSEDPEQEFPLEKLVRIHLESDRLSELAAFAADKPRLRARLGALSDGRRYETAADVLSAENAHRREDLVLAAKSVRRGAHVLLCHYPFMTNSFVTEAARELGLEDVNFNAALWEECPGETGCRATDGTHLNGRGYRVMAEVIADRVLALQDVKWSL
jgi:lysophospholipase L1-like esterase